MTPRKSTFPSTAKAKIEIICEDLDAMGVDYSEFIDDELMEDLKNLDEPESEIELPPVPDDSPPEPKDKDLKAPEKKDSDDLMDKINALDDDDDDNDNDD